ncbi:MAG: hypothetical protein M3Q20_00365 [Actinomycetota bacterium]|nr:hypothetical protein [Actinomycetota bacterium]
MNTNMRLDASPLVIVGYATIGGFCGALAGMFVAPCCLGAVGIAAWGALGGGVGWSVGAAIGTISSWNGTRTSESSAGSLVALAVGFVLGGVAIAAWVTTIDGRAAPLRPEIVLVIALDVALAVATCLTVARTSLSPPFRASALVLTTASTLAIATVVIAGAFV